MAMCVMAVFGEAPCQCFSAGGIQTTSPGRISSTGPPHRCTQPRPAVTIRVWPNGCVCHAVRAPGSNVTLALTTRAGLGAWNNESTRTVPVKYSAGPLLEGCEPLLLMSISEFLQVDLADDLAIIICQTARNGTPVPGHLRGRRRFRRRAARTAPCIERSGVRQHPPDQNLRHGSARQRHFWHFGRRRSTQGSAGFHCLWIRTLRTIPRWVWFGRPLRHERVDLSLQVPPLPT